MDDRIGREIELGHACIPELDLFQSIFCRQRFGGAMPHGKRVLEELDNWRLGSEFIRAVGTFDVVRHFFTRDQGPEPEVGRSRVLDELSKCPNVLKGAAWDVEAGGSEVEFIFRHGFSGFHHQFLIGADFAVHNASNGGRRLL